MILKLDFSDMLWIGYWICPGFTFFIVNGDLSWYFTEPTLKGQFTYVLSKLFGLYALHALCLQAVVGLLGKDAQRLLRISADDRFHRALGMFAFTLLLAHICLFLLGVSLRNGHFAWQLLSPNFFNGYYAARVSLGHVAAILLCVAVPIGFYLHRATRSRRWLHRTSLIAIVFVSWHALSIGTETRTGIMPWLYAGMLLIVSCSLLYRCRCRHRNA
jgi:predicted ferric reductase